MSAVCSGRGIRRYTIDAADAGSVVHVADAASVGTVADAASVGTVTERKNAT